MKATYVRDLGGWLGTARLYKVPEYKWSNSFEEGTAEYVAVSAVVALGGPETFIFPADADGTVLNWLELEGSFHGALDHVRALNNAGYEEVVV